jgi:hypothetical protein
MWGCVCCVRWPCGSHKLLFLPPGVKTLGAALTDEELARRLTEVDAKVALPSVVAVQTGGLFRSCVVGRPGNGHEGGTASHASQHHCPRVPSSPRKPSQRHCQIQGVCSVLFVCCCATPQLDIVCAPDRPRAESLARPSSQGVRIPGHGVW